MKLEDYYTISVYFSDTKYTKDDIFPSSFINSEEFLEKAKADVFEMLLTKMPCPSQCYIKRNKFTAEWHF